MIGYVRRAWCRCLRHGHLFEVDLPLSTVAPVCPACGSKGRRADRFMPGP